VCGDFIAHGFPAASYDIVTLWATLEHLPAPGAFLEEACRVLRPGGVLALSVPNHGSATQRLLGRRNRYVGADHLNYFTPLSLKKLVERHGFRTELMLTRKVNPFIVYQDLRRDPSDGASVDEVIADQSVTDGLKNSAKYAPLRTVHSLAERVIGRFGLGDLLLLRATRTAVP
jgi:SAM-dependent methyltransferase